MLQISMMEFFAKIVTGQNSLTVFAKSSIIDLRRFNTSRICFSYRTVSSTMYRSSYPEVLVRKVILKICSKFTGEHPCRSAISIKLLCNFIEITLWHGCSPVNLLHIFRTPFYKNTLRSSL